MTNQASPAEILLAALEPLRAEWPNLLTHAKLSFDAEREWVLQACTKNDYAARTALNNVDAVCNALRNVAAVGVSLDPARKLAYVLPRDNAMVYDLSYMGMLDIAISSGALVWAQAHLVHANDTFELLGYDAPPVHKRNPFAAPEARGEVIGAYVVVKLPGGDYLTNTMSIMEINAIRDRSPSWKKDKKGPWKDFWAEMAKKTVVKNAYKYWPRSEALDRAIHYLNTEGGQGIDLTPEDEARTRLSIWLDKVKAAATPQALRELLPVARKEFEAAQDPDGYQEVRNAAIARDKALGGNGKPAATTAAAPTQAPAPAPAPAAGSRDAVLALIGAAADFQALENTGPLIDALTDEADVEACNQAYNDRLEQLKAVTTA